MLTERNLELLTAFVDGEPTQRQRKAVLRLLNVSSEARSVLQDIQEASHRMRELPHRKLGELFAGQVLQTIADRGLQPAPSKAAPGRRWSLWAGYAAAASVIVAVGLGIYFAKLQPSNTTTLAVNNPPPKKTSFQVAFKELAQKPNQELLARQLQTETAVHLDVTVHNNTQAVEHLQDVLKSQGIQIIIDKKADAKLKKEGPEKVEYLVYAENVRTEELEAILRQLADAPKDQSAPKSTFQTMMVRSLSTADRQNLSGLLGVAAGELEGPQRKSEAQLFENTIIDGPMDKIKKTIPSPSSSLERFAMVIANDSGTTGAVSAEVQRFLAGRRQQQPGTLQVLFLIRQA